MTRLQILAAAVLVLCVLAFGSGWQVSTWRHEAAAKRQLEQLTADRDAALERVSGVSAAYQQVLAELRRIDNRNRVETIRETNRVEYRCLLPADGQRLLDNAVTAANAAAGRPAPALPTDRAAPDP
jgi:hypothetical protein